MNPLWGWAGNPSGSIAFFWKILRKSKDVNEWVWCTSMRNGDGDEEGSEESKKLGHTLPPNLSSSLAIVEFGMKGSRDRRNRKAPFHAGQTGIRAYFCMDAIFLLVCEIFL